MSIPTRAPSRREHVEIAYPDTTDDMVWNVEGMSADGVVCKQLSLDKHTGEGTQWVKFPKGWTAPAGVFNEDLEIFVLDGDLNIGGFKLHKYSYSFIPAGIATGAFEAVTDCVALLMPFGWLKYDTSKYGGHGPEVTVTDANLDHPRWTDYIPCIDTPSMGWDSTTFLPPEAQLRTAVSLFAEHHAAFCDKYA